jgi:hypothetical protein
MSKLHNKQLLFPLSGSFTGSLLGSASYALTASYALNGGTGFAFPFSGSAIVSGSLTTIGSQQVSGSLGLTGSIYIGSTATNNILITTAAGSSYFLNEAITVQGPSFGPASAEILLHNNTTDAIGSRIDMARSYANNNLSAGNDIGELRFWRAYGNLSFTQGAYIKATAISGSTVASGPAALYFGTTPSGSITPQQRLVIQENGNVGIGAPTASATLHVSGASIIFDIPSKASGYVLSSNASGNATWVQPATLAVFPYTGSAIISGSLTVTGSVNITGSTTQIGNNTLLGNTTLSGSITISGSTGPGSPTASVQIYGDIRQTGYHRFDPVTTTLNQSISASYIYVSGSTSDLYFAQSGQGYANNVRLRWLEGGSLYTGILRGGVVSSTPGTTTFNISSGSGLIFTLNASTGSEPFPTVQYISWPTYTAQPITNSGSAKITYVGIKSDGTVQQQVVPWGTNDINQWDDSISLGVVLHLSGSVSTGVFNAPQISYGGQQKADDFFRAFGPLKISGHTLKASGSSPTLSIIKDAGTSYREGANYTINANHPSTVVENSISVSKIYRYHLSGSTPVIDTGVNNAGYTQIDNKNYVDTTTGTLALVGGAYWSIQRVFWVPNSPTNAFIVYYGNDRYRSLVDATNARDSEPFIEAPNTAQNAIFVGYIIIQGGGSGTPARDLLNASEATIIPAGLFRNVGGIGSSGTNFVSTTLAGLADVSLSGNAPGDLLVYGTGTTWNNTKLLTGSYGLSGSLTATRNISAASFTGSLFGTASWAVSASWAPGGSSTPGGSNTQIQFNSASAFAGTSSFAYIYTSQSLQQGNAVKASGLYSHAQGLNTTASIDYSHAEGYNTVASGTGSHAEGLGAQAIGNYSHAEGEDTQATGPQSHAEGDTTIAVGSHSHAEGRFTTAYGLWSHAEGQYTTASGYYSHAEGQQTKTLNDNSHAEGTYTTTNGIASHAEGSGTTTIGDSSHAEGNSTSTGQLGYIALYNVPGQYQLSPAYGDVSGQFSTGNYIILDDTNINDTYGKIAMLINSASWDGTNTNVSLVDTSISASDFKIGIVGVPFPSLANYSISGVYAHSEGSITQAVGDYSHTQGYYTVAAVDGQSVVGRYNIPTNGKHAFIVGNGSSNASRSNLLLVSGSEVQITGSLIASGSTYLRGLIDTAQSNVITIDTSTGQLYYTASSAIGGGGGGSPTTIKAGSGSAASFSGSPRTSTITFGSAFSNNLYAVTVTGEDARTWTIESKSASSFVINSNSSVALTGPAYWIATPFNS